MLKRKIADLIEQHFHSGSDRILLIDGARQVGKTCVIRSVGQKLFANFIEINMLEDSHGSRLFERATSVDDFYLRLSSIAGNKMGTPEDTLIFIDEIQAYPHLLTLLKFLRRDNRFTYIACGTMLDIALCETASIPMGSIRKVRMYPLDFEEFLYANGVNDFTVQTLQRKFEARESRDEGMHARMLDHFKRYLLVGGFPAAVCAYLETKNIQAVREVQREIQDRYTADASEYDTVHKRKARRIYDLIPSNMESKKKRVVVQRIEGKKGSTFADYEDEFEYLIRSGIVLSVQAISTPTFPLIESSGKKLLKLYLNDVGILTSILYGNNVHAVLDDAVSIRLGSVYECTVASELSAHGFRLFYYDNRSKGEADFLINDYSSLSAVPIRVKSGKDYTVHSALNTLVNSGDDPVQSAFVLSNSREIKTVGKITYLPIYDVMFFGSENAKPVIF